MSVEKCIGEHVAHVLSVNHVVNAFCCSHVEVVALGEQCRCPFELDVLRIDVCCLVLRCHHLAGVWHAVLSVECRKEDTVEIEVAALRHVAVV